MRILRSALLCAACVAFGLGAGEARADAPDPAPQQLTAPPWLGVTMDAGGDIGVAVEHVVRGSPADKAGIKVGDRIVSVDGGAVTRPTEVSRAVQSRRVGENVTVGVERKGTAVTTAVTLAPRPAGDDILKMDLVGLAPPAWTNVTALAGAPSTLTQLKGRVVLVDFWATWCGPCRMVAPRLSAMRDRLGAQGLSVVGITTDSADKAAVFAERTQMRYPVVVDNDGATSKAYGITSLPTMLLVDKKGIVRDVFVGFDPSGDARLEDAVKRLLAEK